MKTTPLYEKHLELSGKIIDFSGWALPVEYSGILSEHEAVRTKSGLFDVSHMGEITVKGEEAEKFLQMIVTNDVSVLTDGQIAYTTMCYPTGGVVDDLLVYKNSDEDFLLVVNASNTDKDFEWLESHISGKVEVKNVSPFYAQLALQGPKAQTIIWMWVESVSWCLVQDIPEKTVLNYILHRKTDRKCGICFLRRERMRDLCLQD